MKTFFTAGACFFALNLSRAEMPAPIPLWPDGAPGALGAPSNDIPTLTLYLPDGTNTTGAAMVICPGGGYSHLAPHEGKNYALWLNQHGVACFVFEIPARFEWLPASGDVGGRGARDAIGAGAGGGLED